MTKLIIETPRRITLGGDRQGALILATSAGRRVIAAADIHFDPIPDSEAR